MNDAVRTENTFKWEEVNSPHLCPVCGRFEFEYHGSMDQCEVCGWWDDLVQELNPEEDACMNRPSLNRARECYKKCGKVRESYVGRF